MVAKPSPPVRRLIAGTNDGRDITRGLIDSLPYIQAMDKLLQMKGRGDYSIYQDILRDDQVKATLEQRRKAVIARDWKVIPGDDSRKAKKAASFIEDTLTAIGWDNVTDKMLYGVFYGFAVGECMWTQDGNYITLDEIKVRDRKRFVFDPDFNLKLRTTKDPNGEVLPPKKFWTFNTGADHDDEPYGLGLAHWLYWPVWFKRNHTNFWLTFSEKFGSPTVIGKFPNNATEDEQKLFLDALQQVKNETALAISEGMAVELLQAGRSGNGDYEPFYKLMDAAISKVVLSQTMTTDDGASRAQADVHMEVQKDIVESDAWLVNESFNRQVVRWLCAWNFPGVAYPRVERVLDDAPDLYQLAQRDQTITQIGFKPTREYIEATYGIEIEEPQADTQAENAQSQADSADFAEVDIDTLDMVINAIENDQWQNIEDTLIAPILDTAINQPEKLISDISELYPDMKTEKLEAHLQKILFISALIGLAESDGKEVSLA